MTSLIPPLRAKNNHVYLSFEVAAFERILKIALLQKNRNRLVEQ